MADHYAEYVLLSANDIDASVGKHSKETKAPSYSNALLIVSFAETEDRLCAHGYRLKGAQRQLIHSPPKHTYLD